MVILKSILGLVAGAIAGYIGGIIIGIPLYIVAGLLMWDSARGNALATGVARAIFFLGMAIGVYIPIKKELDAQKARKLEEEAAEELRKWREQAAKHALKEQEETRRRHEAKAAEMAVEATRQRDELQYRIFIVRQLKSSPRDRLSFEYETRQRSIQALQTKNVRLSREREDMFDLNEEMIKGDNYNLSAFDRACSLGDEISGNEREISIVEKEMQEIQQMLNTKWNGWFSRARALRLPLRPALIRPNARLINRNL